MEPEPDPSIPFFPLNNFSTKATFPVRAASSSSCSFPIPDTSLQRQGNRNPTNLPYTPPFPPPPTPFFTVWCGKASERIPLTACCCCTVEIGVTDAADQLWRALLSSVHGHAGPLPCTSPRSSAIRSSGENRSESLKCEVKSNQGLKEREGETKRKNKLLLTPNSHSPPLLVSDAPAGNSREVKLHPPSQQALLPPAALSTPLLRSKRTARCFSVSPEPQRQLTCRQTLGFLFLHTK